MHSGASRSWFHLILLTTPRSAQSSPLCRLRGLRNRGFDGPLMDRVLLSSGGARNVISPPPGSEVSAVNAGPRFSVCFPSRSPGGFYWVSVVKQVWEVLGLLRGAQKGARDPAAPGIPGLGSWPLVLGCSQEGGPPTSPPGPGAPLSGGVPRERLFSRPFLFPSRPLLRLPLSVPSLGSNTGPVGSRRRPPVGYLSSPVFCRCSSSE